MAHYILIANYFKAIGHTKEHIKIAYSFIMHNTILSTISSASRRVSAAGTRRAAWLLVATATLLPCGHGVMAQDDEEDKSLTPAIPGSVRDLPGQEITRATIGKYLSVGFDTDQSKQFVLYNVGTGQFLGVGGYWGSHASLTTIPRPFWLSGRGEDTQAALPAYLRYAESQTGDANSWGSQFFQQTSFQVGSAESSRHGNATYDKLVVVSNGTVLYDVSGTVGDGSAFIHQIANFSFANDDSYIEAVIDISNTGGAENAMQNILSVGQDITSWSSTTPIFHLYAYVKNDVKRVRIDDCGPNWNEHTDRFGGSDHSPITVGADNKVYVTIAKNDILVNGVSCVPAVEAKSLYRDTNPIANYSNYTATKGFTSGQFGRHYYDNAPVTVSNIDLKANVGSDKKFICEYPGSVKKMEATIDLTSCTQGIVENVLSIGNNIADWGGGSGSENIHFYYDIKGGLIRNNNNSLIKGPGVLQIAAVNNSNVGGKKINFENVDGIIKVTLDEDGLHIKNLTDNTDLDMGTWNTNNSVVTAILNSINKVQIGSAEGGGRSNAGYSDVSLTYAPKSDSELIEDLFASGETGNSTINFAKNEFFQGDIDLDGVQEGTTLLTIKAVAADGSTDTGNNLPSLTFTYQGEDEGHDVVQVKYEYNAETRTLDGWTRGINVNKGDQLSFKIANDGLTVGGKNLFPSGNLLPTLPYIADLAGQTVHFKTDKFGNFLLDDKNKLIIDQENGKPFKSASSSGYLYSMDDQTDGVAVFISSQVRKRSSASTKEGAYMAWAPYADDTKTYGDVGVFADRSLRPKFPAGAKIDEQQQILETLLANSRWFIEPVENPVGYAGKHIYRLYLDVKDQKVLSVVNKVQQEPVTKSGKFYLHAKQDMVLGNEFEPYTNAQTSTQVNEDPVYTSVEAEVGDPDRADLGYWLFIPVSEYLKLFEGAKTDFEAMLDYSYLLSDPDFSREDVGITGWRMDKSLLGDSTKTKVENLWTEKDDEFTVYDIRIGYDYYSMKTLDANDYTDERGVKDESGKAPDGTYKPKYQGSNEYRGMKNRERNHARYMGFQAENKAHGCLYQEVTVNDFGWYAISCKGFATETAPAELFIQKASETEGNWVSKKLHILTNDEYGWLHSLEDKGWPYDCLYVDNTSLPLPMYNALVAMNDENTHTGPMVVNDQRISGKQLVDSLTTQIIYYVSKEDLDANHQAKLRFGVYIPEQKQPTEIHIAKRPQRSDITVGGDGTFDVVLPLDPWTIVDDFHLLFGGNAPDPHLVLNEDSTSLDYIDNSVHRFVSRPMNLVRTFRANSWNTIILPVNLTQEQFTTLFGATAKLAELDHLTEKTIEFKTVTEQDGVLLQAFKPYIIYVDEEHKTGNGDEYTGKLYMLGGNGMPTEASPYYKLYAPAGNYATDNVTLEANYASASTIKGYDFAHDSQAVKDSLYTYQGTTATDGSGTNSPLIAFGTLCKTYSGKEEGEHALLKGRPTLQGAYVFNSNNMIKIHNNYGVKGFRCWFTTKEEKGSTQSLSNLAVSIDGIWDGTTTIGSINATNDAYDHRHNEGVYSLSGQKLRSDASLDGLPAGIYIVNGVKQSVR